MVRGDEDRFEVAEAPLLTDPVDVHTGYLEVTEDAAGVKDPEKLQDLAALYLELYRYPRRQLSYDINLGWGKDPLIHYQLGDWILKHDGSESDGKPEKVRVLRCWYSGDQSGDLACGITVNDWFGGFEQRVIRKIEGIVGGLAGSARPNRRDVPPEAPTPGTPYDGAGAAGAWRARAGDGDRAVHVERQRSGRAAVRGLPYVLREMCVHERQLPRDRVRELACRVP